MDMFVLLFSKVHSTLTLTTDGTCQVIATVTNTFNFSHFAKHTPNFKFTFRTQTAFGHTVQIIGYFYLHAVTDVFVFFDTAEQFVEFVFV